MVALGVSPALYADVPNMKTVNFETEDFKKVRVAFWTQLKLIKNKINDKKFTDEECLGLTFFFDMYLNKYKNRELEVLLISKENLNRLQGSIKVDDIIIATDINGNIKSNKKEIEMRKSIFAEYIGLYLEKNPKIERMYCNDKLMRATFKASSEDITLALLDEAAQFAKNKDFKKAKITYQKAIDILLGDSYILKELFTEVYSKYIDMYITSDNHNLAIVVCNEALKNMKNKEFEGYYKIAIFNRVAYIANKRKDYKKLEIQYHILEKLIAEFLGDDSDEMIALWDKFLSLYKTLNNEKKALIYKKKLYRFIPNRFPELAEKPDFEEVITKDDRE